MEEPEKKKKKKNREKRKLRGIQASKRRNEEKNVDKESDRIRKKRGRKGEDYIRRGKYFLAEHINLTNCRIITFFF